MPSIMLGRMLSLPTSCILYAHLTLSTSLLGTSSLREPRLTKSRMLSSRRLIEPNPDSHSTIVRGGEEREVQTRATRGRFASVSNDLICDDADEKLTGTTIDICMRDIIVRGRRTGMHRF